MADLDTMCERQIYRRANPTEPLCTGSQYEQELEEISHTCYPKCGADDYTGEGPVCWKTCPEGTHTCGGALCLDPKEECTAEMSKGIS